MNILILYYLNGMIKTCLNFIERHGIYASIAKLFACGYTNMCRYSRKHCKKIMRFFRIFGIKPPRNVFPETEIIARINVVLAVTDEFVFGTVLGEIILRHALRQPEKDPSEQAICATEGQYARPQLVITTIRSVCNEEMLDLFCTKLLLKVL